LWFSSDPVGEAGDPAHWDGEFGGALRGRIVFNSHAPFGNDTVAEAERIMGKAWVDTMMQNGRALLKLEEQGGEDVRRDH
jgi:hypothetical protein